MLADEKGKLTMGKQFLAGVGAGTIEAVVAVTPMETVKTKLIQTNQSLIPGVRSILKESGVAGLYQVTLLTKIQLLIAFELIFEMNHGKGVAATVLKQGSNQGLRFMFFNKYKDIMTDNGKKSLPPIFALFGGMAAGCFSTLGRDEYIC